MPEEWRRQRARLAALSRHYPNHPDLGAADRLALKLKRAEDFITRLVIEPPELAAEERERLASILTGGVDAAD